MTVFIDEPRWPAHGTVWSHLISDSSLLELHEFAFKLGIPRRGFDLDHYDVPASLYDSAVRLGAVPVTGRELTVRLRDSGFRVPGRERDVTRNTMRTEFLRAEWSNLLSLLTRQDKHADRAKDNLFDTWEETGNELLLRWSEPHRAYHNEKHLEDILLSLQQLTLHGETLSAETLLAAWFHDAVYDGIPGEDERGSARLAVETLAALGVKDDMYLGVEEIILATEPGAGGSRGMIRDQKTLQLLDADLAIFASPERRYEDYTKAVRVEYSHVAEPDFIEGRALILETYLAKQRIYNTAPALMLWEERARKNLELELKNLRRT